MLVHGSEVRIHGRFIKTARLADEWYEDVRDPEAVIAELRQSPEHVDVFTFWQRLPETTPHYPYYREWESIAALPVKSFAHWWQHQVDAKTRNLIRKAEKKGVEVRMTPYTDDFVKGITDIFNETPVRQGRPFYHYGKDFETVKREFSSNIHREEILGAYWNNELIGFIMFAYAGRYAMTTQIIGKMAHRDKSPVNALIANAVLLCEKKQIPYLVYAHWPKGSLADFKRHNGFEKIDLPRYYVALTMKGKAAVKAGLHSGIPTGMLPEKLTGFLMELRTKWYMRRLGTSKSQTRQAGA